jgi:hypothetical protein
MRTYEKAARNSFRMRSSKTKDLKRDCILHAKRGIYLPSMSLKEALTYPPRNQTKRQFHPSSAIPKEPPSIFAFDYIFRYPVMRSLEKFSGHAIIPLLIGAAITATGHSQMLVRSAALIICAVWLCFDLGVWVSKRKWSNHKKAMVFSFLSCLISCSSMGIMYWFLDSTLHDQQDDVWQKLEATASTPTSGDLALSTFTWTNGGSIAIDKNHQLSCLVNQILYDNGANLKNFSVAQGLMVPFELLPGGDSQSVSCLSANGTRVFGVYDKGQRSMPICFDVTLRIEYALVTQPLDRRSKLKRFVANKTDGYIWHGQAVGMPISPCEAFVHH